MRNKDNNSSNNLALLLDKSSFGSKINGQKSRYNTIIRTPCIYIHILKNKILRIITNILSQFKLPLKKIDYLPIFLQVTFLLYNLSVSSLIILDIHSIYLETNLYVLFLTRNNNFNFNLFLHKLKKIQNLLSLYNIVMMILCRQYIL